VKPPGPKPLSVEVAAENLRLPESRPEVVAKLRELVEAFASKDQTRIDYIQAEISGLAAREERAERARAAGYPPETTGLRIHQPSLLETVPS
jgi:hypothetical protein